MADCLFCRIMRGEVPSKKVYEDEHTFAFEDVNPQGPTHVLVIPKKHITGLKEAAAADAELVTLSSGCGSDCAAAVDRRWLPHGAERGPARRAIRFSSSRTSHRWPVTAVAAGIVESNRVGSSF